MRKEEKRREETREKARKEDASSSSCSIFLIDEYACAHTQTLIEVAKCETHTSTEWVEIERILLSNYSNVSRTKPTTTTSTNYLMCQIATIQSSDDKEKRKMSPNDYSLGSNSHPFVDERTTSSYYDLQGNVKHPVDLYTAALHLRQRMREENLIHPSYSAYLNGEQSPRSLFHNCFHSFEAIEWLKKQQLCKSISDGLEIFQVLQKLSIIHHVCDLNEFEYPPSGTSPSNTIKYLYRFRLDDGTADQNRSFQQFASIYETYTSLFTLDKNQCRGVDLQQQIPVNNPYDEQPGIPLKGDNLARMVALRSGGTMQNVERLVDDMIMYGLIRFDECDQENQCDSYCTRKFHNDQHHQYLLSNSHRLLSNKRLDLIALMQHDLFIDLPIQPTQLIKRNETSPFVSVSCPDRSSSISHYHSKISFNRTRSNYHCHESLHKTLLSTHQNETARVSSPIVSSLNGQYHRTNHQRQYLSTTTSSNSSLIDDEQQNLRRISHTDELECTTKLTCTVNTIDAFRRRKSASLNSPANSDNRPTAEELEKLELPWRWRSFSLKRDRRGYGLILQGQGPCYVERLDPYGSSYTSGIRINEYIYAVEGVNVLRRSGKEVERLLSMFDKCTIYTVYNCEEYPQIGTPPNESNLNRQYLSKQMLNQYSSSSNDFNNNSTDNLLTTAKTTTTTTTSPNDASNLIVLKSSPSVSSPLSSQQQQANGPVHSSPTSSIEGASSCSVSPKHSSTTKSRTLTKPFSFFKLNSRSRTNLTSSNTFNK